VDAANPNYCSEDGVLFNKDRTQLVQYPGGKAGSYAIPAGVTRIGYHAFSVCTGLTSVTIPGSATTIGLFAFSGCTGLTNVTLGAGAAGISRDAFAGCTNLPPAKLTRIERKTSDPWNTASAPGSSDVQSYEEISPMIRPPLNQSSRDKTRFPPPAVND
jgi:hypothetical protein